MKKNQPKLQLHRETVRILTRTELNEVGGARKDDAIMLTERGCYLSMFTDCLACGTWLMCPTIACPSVGC